MEVFTLSSLEVTDLSLMMENSWKRCQHYGLKPSDPVYDDIISGNRIREITRQHEQLITHTGQIFSKMNRLIKQSGQMALLIDAQGTILHAVGDPDFSTRAEMVQLQVGANWEERRKGTNAIGLALTEQKAVRVHAEEHYYTSNRFLTCASSPVFSPSGQLIGIINISGKKESYHDYTLTLACLAADSLQNKLIWDEAREEHLITLKELDYTAQNVPMPLLSLDRDNRIVRANQAALRIVGRDALGKEFSAAKGFAVETIRDERHQVWRSVAIQRKPQDEPRLYEFQDIVGICPQLVRTKELAQKAALTEFPIILLGESGTGKELFAQSIHMASLRSAQPFIPVNCSAIPDSLIESELFGYERGAFTGANKEGSIGKFEAAHKGTIFLDEIGDMSLRAQAALLRVLQESTITPVGSAKSKRIDIRIVAATHRNLSEEVAAGRFRADLYYRLKGIQITLPSLRERTDLIHLAGHLLDGHGHSASAITEQAKQKLEQHRWPGNVRELNSALLQASFLAEGGPIEAWHLQLGDDMPVRNESSPRESVLSLKEAEMEAIKRALRQTEGNLSKAASLLQIGRTTLYRKIQEYDMTPF